MLEHLICGLLILIAFFVGGNNPMVATKYRKKVKAELDEEVDKILGRLKK